MKVVSNQQDSRGTIEESNAFAENKDDAFHDRVVTIPNVICFVRLIGALSLFWFALNRDLHVFVGVFVVLNLSDWIDGRLARWLNQRSDFGARLDSFSDAVLYGALFFGMFYLRWDVLARESPWWVAGLMSYTMTTGAGLWKYGRMPSYHTYGAKFSQWLVLIGAVCLLLDYAIWPFRIAMLAVTLTNIEATILTWRLSEWTADVLSIFHLRSIDNVSKKVEGTP